MNLFILDIDNTITMGNTVWEAIHHQQGTWSDGKKYLSQFVKEKIDFVKFAKLDVACWKGMPSSELHAVFQKITIRPGFKEFITYLKKNNVKTAFISSSIYQFAEYLQNIYEVDYIISNPLEIIDDKLTGDIEVAVCCFEKEIHFKKLIKDLGIPLVNTGGVGDSVFDLPYLNEVNYPFYFEGNIISDNSKLVKVTDFMEIKEWLIKNNIFNN